MKKYLLPDEGHFYKANLHCHSTISDGKYTPEELKKLYTEQGYSIIAFTDHEILMPHNELSDEGFLALNGCEISANAPGPDGWKWRSMRTCHMNCIAIEPDNFNQVCYHRTEGPRGYYDHCPQVYDDLLRDGRRILAVAGDDTHTMEYAFGGFTMIKAAQLEYRAVTDALLRGHSMLHRDL